MGAAASAVPTTTCNAKTKRGTLCRKPAGHGTDHPGYGRCSFHFGGTESGNFAAAKQRIATLGAELEMDPHDAILLTVRKAAMWERYCSDRVAELRDDQLIVDHLVAKQGPHGTTIEKSSQAELNIWLREHQRALEQLARLAKTAIDAGVAERQVRIAEQLAGDLAQAFDALLTRLGVKEHPDAPAAVRAALQLVEGPKAIAA